MRDADRAARSIEELTDGISALRRSIRAADWDSCDREASSSIAVGRDALAQVLDARQRDRVLATALGHGHARLRKALEAMARSNRAKTFFGGLQARVSPEHRDALDGSLSALAEGTVDDVRLLDELTRRATVPAQMRDLDGDLAIAAITQGLLGSLHSGFNREVGTRRRLGSTRSETEEIAKLRAAADEVDAGLLRRRQQLFAVLGDRAEVRGDIAIALASWVVEVLPRFARDQARGYAAYERWRASGSKDRVAEIGDLLARSGLLTRICVASQAAAHRVAIELARIEPRDDALSVLLPDERDVLAEPLPHGPHTPLSELESTEVGSFVEVSGVVSSITVERVQEKLVTIVSLTTPRGDATARALVRFAHLPHAGLTEGAYFRASGTHRPTDDGATIEVEALSLAEMARGDWTLGLIRLARPWFQPWRTNAFASWSLGVHAPDVDERLLGAGELLFTDPLRKRARR